MLLWFLEGKQEWLHSNQGLWLFSTVSCNCLRETHVLGTPSQNYWASMVTESSLKCGSPFQVTTNEKWIPKLRKAYTLLDRAFSLAWQMWKIRIQQPVWFTVSRSFLGFRHQDCVHFSYMNFPKRNWPCTAMLTQPHLLALLQFAIAILLLLAL